MGLLSNSNKRERLSHGHAHVLKLVHPGGFVELHTNPVMASEVMNKNPRHCVTRPDIFRFPWIVVSPQAILRPGNVFFIVPCRTIRHLLKSTSTTIPNHTSLSLKHRFESSVDEDCLRGHKLSNSEKIQCFKKQQSLSVSCMKLRTPRDREKHIQRKGGNKAHSFVRDKPAVYCSEYKYYASNDSGKERAWISSEFPHSEQLPKLKSCLKKDNKSHNARSRNLKVRFACTQEEVRSQQHLVHNKNLRLLPRP